MQTADPNSLGHSPREDFPDDGLSLGTQGLLVQLLA